MPSQRSRSPPERAVGRATSTCIGTGKKALQAYVAVMRKLLHAIYGMLKTNTALVPEKFHAAA